MTLSDPQPGFQGRCILKSRISQKRCILGTKLLKNTNRKPLGGSQNFEFGSSDPKPRPLWGHFMIQTQYGPVLYICAKFRMVQLSMTLSDL